MLRFLLIISTGFFFFIFLCKVNTSQAAQANNGNSKPLRIAVAANFTPVLKILLKDFTQQTDIKTQVISSASGAIFLQIKHGAPFDIFLSADNRRPQALEQLGFTLEGSRKTYAIGQLALYSAGLPLTTSKSDNESTSPNLAHQSAPLLQSILNNPPKRFAIANPDIAPYGKAAQETLNYLGLWPIYQSRLVVGINIGQTFTQLRSKAVSAGLVAHSQLVLNNLSGIIVPSDYHQPIEQQLVIMKASKQQSAAKQLSDFLLSEESQNIITNYGYAPLSAPFHNEKGILLKSNEMPST